MSKITNNDKQAGWRKEADVHEYVLVYGECRVSYGLPSHVMTTMKGGDLCEAKRQ